MVIIILTVISTNTNKLEYCIQLKIQQIIMFLSKEKTFGFNNT